MKFKESEDFAMESVILLPKFVSTVTEKLTSFDQLVMALPVIDIINIVLNTDNDRTPDIKSRFLTATGIELDDHSVDYISDVITSLYCDFMFSELGDKAAEYEILLLNSVMIVVGRKRYRFKLDDEWWYI